MLGHKLVQVLSEKADVMTTVRGKLDRKKYFGLFENVEVVENIDVLDFDNVTNLVRKNRPDVVINSIGVIKQKPEVTDVVNTLEINSVFPHRVAKLCDEVGTRFLTLSTDCVFDGADGGYNEEDFPNAKDLYGKSKHLGEVISGNSVTLRSSIIGRELATSKSIVEWFLSNRGGTVKGFKKAIYSGFPTVVIAEIIADIIENKKDLKGLYNVSSEPINKFELLSLIKRKLNLDIEIEPFEDFDIDRSLDSSKFRNETGFVPENWEKMIEKMLDDPTPYDKWRNEIS